MTKTKFPRAAAVLVARELCEQLKPFCERLIVAGSLRRRRPEVGDIEILYVSKILEERFDLLQTIKVPAVDLKLAAMLLSGVIDKRPNSLGAETWGEANKYAIHCRSLIPVDFFAATESNWWNYLVCRTGPAESNIRIAIAAKAKGWQWHPTGKGFRDARGQIVAMKSERDVFESVGLLYKEPWER